MESSDVAKPKPLSKFRLVVSDLDGTLLNGEGEVSGETKDALRAVIGPACPLVLATARGLMELPILDCLPCPLYLVIFGGAHCVERRTGGEIGTYQFSDIYTKGLSNQQARAAVDAAEAEQATVWLFQPDRIYVKHGAIGASEGDAWLFKHAAAASVHTVDSFEAALAEERTLEVVAVVPPDADSASQELQRSISAAGTHLEVLSMAPDPFVSMKSTDVDKGWALLQLCKHIDVLPQEVIAFGDGTNDIPMLRLAGCGVAVANARPATKEASDVVLELSHTEDAVAHELRRLLAEGRL